MYRINKTENKISKLEERTFKELGFKERDHLQEWLVGNPSALGEELLIIQKEFDGFQGTYERLDLLALDKQGDLVIIENKLDDSGKDVTWQVLKYASYCASLSKEEIRSIYQSYLDKWEKGRDAEEVISQFYDNSEFNEISLNEGNSQRIVMVAGRFRKEVTSTVLWLMNFNIRMQCFKVTPYAFGEELFLNVDQILPVVDTEDLSVSMAIKNQDEIATKKAKTEIHKTRFEFWSMFLEKVKGRLKPFEGKTPSEYNWIGTTSGISGVNYTIWLAKESLSIRLYIDRGKDSDDLNLQIFDALRSDEKVIESAFGQKLNWDRAEKYRACVIGFEIKNGGYSNKDMWDVIHQKTIESMNKMISTFDPYIKKIKL